MSIFYLGDVVQVFSFKFKFQEHYLQKNHRLIVLCLFPHRTFLHQGHMRLTGPTTRHKGRSGQETHAQITPRRNREPSSHLLHGLLHHVTWSSMNRIQQCQVRPVVVNCCWVCCCCCCFSFWGGVGGWVGEHVNFSYFQPILKKHLLGAIVRQVASVETCHISQSARSVGVEGGGYIGNMKKTQRGRDSHVDLIATFSASDQIFSRFLKTQQKMESSISQSLS